MIVLLRVLITNIKRDLVAIFTVIVKESKGHLHSFPYTFFQLWPVKTTQLLMNPLCNADSISSLSPWWLRVYSCTLYSLIIFQEVN